jgi:hypothetical protein
MFFSVTNSFADLQAHHQHEDWFDEKTLLIGLKGGPQLTTYTFLRTDRGEIEAEPKIRGLVGPSIQWVYEIPRFEVDFFWLTRGGINTTESMYGGAFPVLLKFAIPLETTTDLELGSGIEPDFIFSGPLPYRNTYIGWLFQFGLTVDFTSAVFEFEVRYNVGIKNFAPTINGAYPRDVQTLLGWLWHF